MEAKALAEEQKRINPDCWKRKRTNSVRTAFDTHHYQAARYNFAHSYPTVHRVPSRSRCSRQNPQQLLF